jgi:hypothetical protein
VLGLNFYPQWSTQLLHIDNRGRLSFRATEQEGSGFGPMIEDYHRRYNAPVIITETSAFGADELRMAWLEASLRAIRELRERGVPVLGYTWFPLFTMIDWRYRQGNDPKENYLLELGLYRLRNDGGPGRWLSTPLVERFRHHVNNPGESIGSVNQGVRFEV